MRLLVFIVSAVVNSLRGWMTIDRHLMLSLFLCGNLYGLL